MINLAVGSEARVSIPFFCFSGCQVGTRNIAFWIVDGRESPRHIDHIYAIE